MWTKAVNKSFEHKLWIKVMWTKSCEKELWTKVVDKSCEQKYLDETRHKKFKKICGQKLWAKV